MAQMQNQIGQDKIFESIKVGDLLKNKRTFRAMKDAGVINDYNAYFQIIAYPIYVEQEDGSVRECFGYFGRKPKDGEDGSSMECPCSMAEYKRRSGLVTYKGYRFVLAPISSSDVNMGLRLLGKVVSAVAV